MNNPNPLIPQGSLLEQTARGKPHLRVALFIVAVHLVFLGGLLIQGCKREATTALKTGAESTNEPALPPLSPDSLYAASTNPVPQPGFDPAASSALTAHHLTASQPGLVEPAPAPAAQDYVVVRNDSFYSIGKKLGVTPSAIAKANPGVDSTRLRIGQKLIIPAPTAFNGARSGLLEARLGSEGANIYVVKPGDTLLRIAKSSGVSVAEIKALNGLGTDRINAGQKLRLPAPKAPSGPATTPVTNPGPLPAPSGGASNL